MLQPQHVYRRACRCDLRRTLSAINRARACAANSLDSPPFCLCRQTDLAGVTMFPAVLIWAVGATNTVFPIGSPGSSACPRAQARWLRRRHSLERHARSCRNRSYIAKSVSVDQRLTQLGVIATNVRPDLPARDSQVRPLTQHPGTSNLQRMPSEANA